MNLKTELLLFCISCIALILLMVFTDNFDFIIFPGLFGCLFWLSRIMRIDRESKQEKP